MLGIGEETGADLGKGLWGIPFNSAGGGEEHEITILSDLTQHQDNHPEKSLGEHVTSSAIPGRPDSDRDGHRGVVLLNCTTVPGREVRSGRGKLKV